MLESSLDKFIHSVLCSLQLCQMVPIAILQSYSERVCLINLGLFSLSASMFSYRCSSLILKHPCFFPMTITLVPGSTCLVLAFTPFLPLFVHFREEKTSDITFRSWSFLGSLTVSIPKEHLLAVFLHRTLTIVEKWQQLPILHWYVVPHSLSAFHFQLEEPERGRWILLLFLKFRYCYTGKGADCL